MLIEENASLKRQIDIYLKEINQMKNNHNSLIAKFNSDQRDFNIVLIIFKLIYKILFFLEL